MLLLKGKKLMVTKNFRLARATFWLTTNGALGALIHYLAPTPAEFVNSVAALIVAGGIYVTTILMVVDLLSTYFDE